MSLKEGQVVLITICGIVLALYASASFPSCLRDDTQHLQQQIVPAPAAGFTNCTNPSYNARIFSFSPLVIYIENFVTEAERAYLIEIATPLYAPSNIVHDDGTTAPHTGRTSTSAYLPEDDQIVSCIRRSAMQFQGGRTEIESLQAVKYEPGQHYAFHYDWLRIGNSTARFRDRFSSFFVILDGACTGCQTSFPYLTAPVADEWWNDKLDVNESNDGVAFRAIAGNAVFWVNLHEDGAGDERVLHAGSPVLTGRKIGLNIWTREERLIPTS